jgi:hypothetical protein
MIGAGANSAGPAGPGPDHLSHVLPVHLSDVPETELEARPPARRPAYVRPNDDPNPRNLCHKPAGGGSGVIKELKGHSLEIK